MSLWLCGDAASKPNCCRFYSNLRGQFENLTQHFNSILLNKANSLQDIDCSMTKVKSPLKKSNYPLIFI